MCIRDSNKVFWTPFAGSAEESKSFRALAAQSAILTCVEAVFTLLIAITTGRMQDILRRALAEIKLNHRARPFGEIQARSIGFQLSFSIGTSLGTRQVEPHCAIGIF